MRRRELIRALKELRANTNQTPWFPTRKEIRETAVKEFQRLGELEELVPEIIEKLEAKS